MKIVKYYKAKSYEPEKNWRRVSLCNQKDISIEHFVKPPKHSSPKHKHPNAQILIVLEGKLAVWTEKDGEVILDKYDTVYIERDEEHIVTNPLDEPSVGIDIFVPGRPFDFWLKNKELLK
ncbi:cupin domain-containing protein [Deferribacter abyssi]|uniref:cupin domain-containing protein n=1 Tax=Deferribacter abyssi TaxID=213806 RepID=UPI003C19ACD0